MISSVNTLLLTVLLILGLQSCATDSKIVKERPNYSLTGAAAAKEIEKFEIDRINYRVAHFKKEKWLQIAKGEEMNKLLNDVSPKTHEMLQGSKLKENLTWLFMAAFVATGFTKRSANDFLFSPLQWSVYGAWIGYGFYLGIDRNKAIDQYNKDLKSRFSPTLGYSFSF